MWLSTTRLVLAISLIGDALAFNFVLQTGANGGISKCGTVNVVWQGGSPPFHMVVIPAFDYPSNISLPTSAWSSSTGRGNYSWTVNYPENTRLVAMMSDSTGEGSGGVSQLYNVAASSATCQLRQTSTDFLFYLNSTTVHQCSPLQVTWDNTASAPVRMLGVIPSGQPFMYTAKQGSNSWTWNTNVAAGTAFILGAFDGGKTGIGGSSDLMTVGQGTSSCLDESSPSSTPAASLPSQTASGSPTNSGGGGVKTVTAIATVIAEGSGNRLSTGAIAGIVISAVLALLALQAALFWFCCRRQVSDLLSHRKDMRTKGIKAGEVDLASQYGEAEGAMDTLGGQRQSGMYGRGNDRRSSYGGTTDMNESTISPFHDDRAASRRDLLADRDGRTLSAYTAYDSDSILAPPRLPIHTRNNSAGSGLTLDLPMSTFDSFSSSISPLDSPNSATMLNSASASSLPIINHPQRPAPTKAQMAASLSLQNPDLERTNYPYGGIMPSASTPTGGLRRHEDAGPAASERGRVEVEDLPPLYKPEWEAEGRHRDSGGF